MYLYQPVTQCIICLLLIVSLHVHANDDTLALKSAQEADDVKLYIVHGYKATTSDHWFTWLARTLEAHSIHPKLIELPNPQFPVANKWHLSLKQQLTQLDNNTFIVAHSLGGLSTLRYLNSALEDKNVAGLILVSGFSQTLPQFPELDTFILPQHEMSTFVNKDRIDKIVVFSSPSDPIVPFAYSQSLAIELGADLVSIPNAGHFMSSDGFSTFPQLRDKLLEMISKK